MIEQPLVHAAGLLRGKSIGFLPTKVHSPTAAERERTGWAQVELVIPTMRLGVDSYLWSLGSYVVIGTLLTLLGFAVYLIRPDRPQLSN
jgi:hypothetical protein